MYRVQVHKTTEQLWTTFNEHADIETARKEAQMLFAYRDRKRASKQYHSFDDVRIIARD